MELLERGGVLAALTDLVEGAIRGEGHVALVRGEAGIGKTSVASALARAVPPDVQVLWGWCDDLAATRPLGPLRDMSSNCPDLGEALRADGDLVRERLLDVLTGRPRPTVVVVEDVHWADTATLDLLTLLGRRIGSTHVLAVLTMREVPGDHPLSALLGQLPSARVRNFPLRPLSRDAVAAMTFDALGSGARRGGDGVYRERAARVFELTAGNPFFVTALLSTPDGRLPATVADLVGSLVARLGADAKRLVRLVSVIPGHAEVTLLEQIDPSLLSALDDAVQLRLLAIDDHTVRFRHELARTAVEESLPEHVRSDLHRGVLAAGEILHLDPARLAHHARGAHDVDVLVRCLPAAARQAARERSHREVISHVEVLEPSMDRLPADVGAELYELWAGARELVSGDGLARLSQPSTCVGASETRPGPDAHSSPRSARRGRRRTSPWRRSSRTRP